MPDPTGHGLASVAASSTTDAWAVWKAVYHWDGSAWSSIPAPGLGNGDPLGYADTVFSAVAAVAPDDAWIAGYVSFLGTPQTLIERWDGSVWRVVPSPVVTGGSEFDAIAALSGTDAWAVGSRAGGHPEFEASRVTLTAHWDGSSWTAIPSPNISNRSHELLDVAAIAPNDVWAVGSYRNITEDYQTLILHWNGSNWSLTPSPNYPGENILHGVSGTSANDVWAVGTAWDGFTARQVFLHWDGSSWSAVTGPGGPTACVGCTGDVLAIGPDDVWAVGSMIGHWNGTHWTVAPNPQVPGAIGTVLRSVAKIGSCDAWAVGGSFPGDGTEDALSIRLGAKDAPPADVTSGLTSSVSLRVRPNPSRSESGIELTLAETRSIRVWVVDLSGRHVRDLASTVLPAGRHIFGWDGRDAAGRLAEGGVYFVTVMAGKETVSARALRLR